MSHAPSCHIHTGPHEGCDCNPDRLTREEWAKFDYRIRKDAKPVGNNAAGHPEFSRDQIFLPRYGDEGEGG
jgi:hypothetical protein